MSATLRVLTILLLCSLPELATAWGDLGHETIAWIAQSYASSTTASAIKDILGLTQSDYMANVSTWADTYRYTSGGRWSAPLHFIDANDNPPSTCSVDYSRDCDSTGCSISAIVNYTSILLDDESSDTTKYDAMKFLIHFIGDLHQPLHDEALEVGGNDINVTYDGDHTNLHHIWDTEIVEQLADGASAESFAKNFTASIKAVSYGWDVGSWLDGTILDDTMSTAMTWAKRQMAMCAAMYLAPELVRLRKAT